ncbi:hypothetical protein Nepgr_017360 [Nepenthes gracilis]|uniref:Uncharacterized protein n=1 Tax=Nepenthes gracilis TaxID=150966 RepID=A0AAD3SRH5_NEPGR|nr:hypothetical protein Nepgr_017360 [Nepenthes gracilis]
MHLATGGSGLDLERPSSGVLLESLGPPHAMPLDFQTQAIAEPADAPGISNADLETGLSPYLTVASPTNDSESSENSVDAESNLEVGIPRIASCPAILQLCNQQIAQLSVPSAGLKAGFPRIVGVLFVAIAALCSNSTGSFRSLQYSIPAFLEGSREVAQLHEQQAHSPAPSLHCTSSASGFCNEHPNCTNRQQQSSASSGA